MRKIRRITFNAFNIAILAFFAFLCLAPFIHILALSLSHNDAVVSGQVGLIPIRPTFSSYKFVLERDEFWKALWMTVKRIAIGLPLGLGITILTAYPLSLETSRFKARPVYMWFLLITMFVNGGMIPTYMVVNELNLMDTVWALVLPGAVSTYNIVLMMNFMRELPAAMREAAMVDGAGHFTLLWRIIVPVSMPSLATITLFIIVGNWNAWFDGIIYMNDTANYPLQSFLRTIITMPDFKYIRSDDWKIFQSISDRTTKAAQIMITTLPVVLVYPFLQRYFTKGITLGSVKG